MFVKAQFFTLNTITNCAGALKRISFENLHISLCNNKITMSFTAIIHMTHCTELLRMTSNFENIKVHSEPHNYATLHKIEMLLD